ncbi:hypothetical protein BDF21DRAFT_393941 [Thamnidium elegans]|nr:hypothetical protein BDF21DRAFT_393941 [Thamnidium elegans]
MFSSSLKGKLPYPTKRITDAITKMSEGSEGKTQIIFVDKYLTSLNHISTTGSKRKLHVVLKCDFYLLNSEDVLVVGPEIPEVSPSIRKWNKQLPIKEFFF